MPGPAQPRSAGPRDGRPAAVVLCAGADEAARIAYWLEQAQIDTVVARDGYAAARALRHGRILALITDRMLPPWPGLDPFPRLRRTHRHLRLVFVGDGTADGRALAAAVGASRVIARPLRRHSVIAAVPGREAAA